MCQQVAKRIVPVLVRIRELVSQRGFGAVMTDAICSLPQVATDLAPMW
jgi:hypothetical protein